LIRRNPVYKDKPSKYNNLMKSIFLSSSVGYSGPECSGLIRRNPVYKDKPSKYNNLMKSIFLSSSVG
ncbi:hypothetical protein, partial [Natronoflexus pectinivorans]|uniref:hypothetical protein n=1 Tax=Natronoflexus pectinivorans TaxID=682526 RepID=UPI001A9FC315